MIGSISEKDKPLSCHWCETYTSVAVAFGDDQTRYVCSRCIPRIQELKLDNTWQLLGNLSLQFNKHYSLPKNKPGRCGGIRFEEKK